MAKTPIIDKGCFISNDVKMSITLNLCETKSMDLISREHCVSPSSVVRIKEETTILLEFYQNFLLSIYKNDVDKLENIINTRIEDIPACFRKSIKNLRKLKKYVL